MENPLEQKLDRFQSEMGQQFDSLKCSISMLAQQLDQKREDNPEEVCLTDTMVEEQCQQQGLSESSYTCAAVFPREKKEEILPFMTEESSGHETVEGIQEPIIQQSP